MSHDALRLALVGGGRMGRTHLDALAGSERVAVTAAMDPVPAARDALAARGLATHASLEELIDAGGFDAALIAAPSDIHGEVVAALAQAGIPMLCEKPCGVSRETAAAAARIAADAGVLLQVGYWRRFVPELVALRERIAAGELGELSLVRCWQWDGTPPNLEFRVRSGGIIVDMGVHELDQTRWLTGQEFGELHAVAAGVTDGPPVPGDPDTVEIASALSGGAVGTISLGRTFPHGDCCWVEVHGLRGHARVEFVWGEEGERVFHRALVDQAEAFAAAVKGEAPRGATADDAVAALEAAERAQAQIGSPAAGAGVSA
jgi:myo-inositol 2-dehydrogenase/D-chiro-inositol 1-dehydrogenase